MCIRDSSKVSLSLVFSAQKSFFIIFTSSELSLNENNVLENSNLNGVEELPNRE